MTHEHFLEVRYYETDQMGIVHHSNYIRYFECGRTALLKDIGLPMEKIEQAGVMLPVISFECHYKYPAKLGDTLRVVSIMDEIPRAKLVIKSEIYNESGKLLCNGEVGIGFIDATTRRPIRCPKDLAELFEILINKE